MRSPDLQNRLQETLGDAYRLERELGGGGMSRVFLATETALERRIVFKVLPPELAAEVSTERFKREIQLAAQLNHPHIVPLLSARSSGGLLYYTMPYVEGESLRSLIAREKPLSLDLAVQLAREVADALDYAHSRQIVHRDIKPENILLSGGHAVVTDFGIARAVSRATDSGALTSATIALGTAAYMSPEQASAEREIDGRSDIYSLACVLFEMLAGELPFTGPTQQAVIARRFVETAPRVQRYRENIPAWVDEVVARGLARTPADRFQTAREFAQALSPSAVSGGSATYSTPTVASPPDSSALRAPRLQRRVLIPAGIAALLLVGYAAFQLSNAGADRVGAARSGAAASAAGPATIAVLPFANLSAGEENEFFADGMTEELINSLSGIEGLRVAARSSVFALKGRKLDVRTVGDTLGVDAVLEGSVRRAGKNLRVTAQLVNTDDGYQMWADDFDRELSDVFKVQDEIAGAIVNALRVKLVRTATRTTAADSRSSNPEAYDLYLKGRFFLNSQGTPGLPLALQHFEKAVQLDPSFARAYAGVAYARSRAGMLGKGDPAVEMPKAKAAALKALALDSSLAEAHGSLAHILFVWEWDHVQAERAFRKAIAVDPDNATTHWIFGILLLDRGRFKEAEKEFRTARELEPLLPHTSSLLGRFFVSTRQPDSAIKYLREAIELGPSLDLAFQQLGHAYLQKRMSREAIDAFRKAASLSGPRDSAHLAYAYAVTGNRAAAERTLSQVLAGSSRYLSPVDMAIANAGLGRKDEAFRWLERGLKDRAPFMDNIRVIAGLESLRSDPRFAPLVNRMGPRGNRPGS